MITIWTPTFKWMSSSALALLLALCTTARSSGSQPAMTHAHPSVAFAPPASAGGMPVKPPSGLLAADVPPALRAPATQASQPTTSVRLDGPESLEALGRRLVEAFGALEHEALRGLTPTGQEYGTVLYPEFVRAGEPLLDRLGPQWGFDNLDAGSREGLRKAFGRLRRKRALTFVSLTTAPPLAKGGVALYRDVRLHATTSTGEAVDLPFVDAIVAHEGHFKVLRYRMGEHD